MPTPAPSFELIVTWQPPQPNTPLFTTAVAPDFNVMVEAVTLPLASTSACYISDVTPWSSMKVWLRNLLTPAQIASVVYDPTHRRWTFNLTCTLQSLEIAGIHAPRSTPLPKGESEG